MFSSKPGALDIRPAARNKAKAASYVRLGGDINGVDTAGGGMTMLMYAAKLGEIEVVQFLLDEGEPFPPHPRPSRGTRSDSTDRRIHWHPELQWRHRPQARQGVWPQ